MENSREAKPAGGRRGIGVALHRSIKMKTFVVTLVLSFSMGAVLLVAGFLLYLSGMCYEYFVSTWDLANAEAAVLEQEDYRNKADQILKIYDSISEEERGDGQSEEYRKRFDNVIDDRFRGLQKSMIDLKDRNGPLNSFIVAIDKKYNRMVYLVDSDQNKETFCHPGSWDTYSQEDIDILLKGRSFSRLEERFNLDKRPQAVITNIPQYGIRCTAGSTLYDAGRYMVMVCVDERLDTLKRVSMYFLYQYIILLLIITLLAAVIGMLLIRKSLVRPIDRMAKAAESYGAQRGKQGLNESHFGNLNIHTGDEVENLANTLQFMEEDIAEYVENLTAVTAEKEKIITELDLGARIQASMLPDQFPAFPERSEFDIYASMKPAREVGGDFYDFFMIDDDHLVLEIADVSGKGIPAALFMMASKILLAEKMVSGLSPAQALEVVNERICEDNVQEMFVTVWLGVLEISTGRLTAANAGHEYPVIIHRDGTAELIHDKHGFVIGGMEGMKYTEYDLDLESGDRLFVYTDGVTEATARGEDLFGMERVLQTAGGIPGDADPRQVLETMQEAIDRFVGDDEQFDDLTMLCMKYTGTEGSLS